MLGHEIPVTCPWCFEPLTLWVDIDTAGRLVTDCEVCCRPWDVSVARSPDADPDDPPTLTVERSDG